MTQPRRPQTEVVAGNDELPRRPADLDDPALGRDPALTPRGRGRGILVWAWIPFAIVIGVVLWAALR